ncbi:hypothetical protein [Collinsella aerofaciens]|uniref:hypothetical protein n=1 Tax=Collinsella aerofaciens TaxID=74426 RepID=UPI0034A53A05
MIAHKAPSDNRHTLLAAALAHQLQKLPPVLIALKDELLARTAGTDMVKAGNRSPNALHGAPFAGICLPSNTARLKRAIKNIHAKQYTRAAKGSNQAANGIVATGQPPQCLQELTNSLPKTDPLYGSSRPQNIELNRFN